MHSAPLGQASAYPAHYDPALLCPIPRANARAALGLREGAALPFLGADVWTAYELSWLGPRGKPEVAIAHLTVPCETPCLIESKSLKLYLGSFNQTVLPSADTLRDRLRQDLSAAVWAGEPVRASVGVRLVLPPDFDRETVHELDGLNLDRLDLDCTHTQPAPELLCSARDEQPVHEVLTSRLLRSLCPVTGQPDWGSVRIEYFGPQIDQAGLLRYLVSLRQHADFHEACVERIFMDLWRRCAPHQLSVQARYTRRGGIDINPFRASHASALPANHRTARQ